MKWYLTIRVLIDRETRLLFLGKGNGIIYWTEYISKAKVFSSYENVLNYRNRYFYNEMWLMPYGYGHLTLNLYPMSEDELREYIAEFQQLKDKQNTAG